MKMAKETVQDIGDTMRIVFLDGSREVFIQNRDEGTSVWVPSEHRAAVALALLGGITDELVERASASLLELVHDTKWDYLFDVESDRRESLRSFLNAIFQQDQP